MKVCEAIKDKDGSKVCRSCGMAMLVSWWIDELKNPTVKDATAMPEDAAVLEKMALSGDVDPGQLCQKMDEISERAGEELRKRLTGLNQTFDVNATDAEEEDK